METKVGTLYSKSKIIEITKKDGTPFFKRTFIIECNAGKFNNYYQFEVSGESLMGDVDRFEKGDVIEVMFETRGRLYTNKTTNVESCFMSFNCQGIKSYNSHHQKDQSISTKQVPQTDFYEQQSPSSLSLDFDVPDDNEPLPF